MIFKVDILKDDISDKIEISANNKEDAIKEIDKMSYEYTIDQALRTIDRIPGHYNTLTIFKSSIR